MSSNNAISEIIFVLGNRLCAVSHIVAPANDWVTGQLFNVDGGLASVRARTRK